MSDIVRQISEAIDSIDENHPSAASVYREDFTDARAELMARDAEIARLRKALKAVHADIFNCPDWYEISDTTWETVCAALKGDT